MVIKSEQKHGRLAMRTRQTVCSQKGIADHQLMKDLLGLVLKHVSVTLPSPSIP